ncbi:unnamed protein product [Linum tenue]|uniref:Methyltransferase-like protein 5 n=1 Tax=Linum tenue TaxID=586396 RepID=A0AAV0HYX6_9ROSI|nr:unnamed protein product [Linum tenue]CAI0390154.1 unnamed protein product [Linum tenue]
MKLKQLEGLLGNLQQFSNPKVELEQYPTGPHIASRMLYMGGNSYGDVTEKVVADFGCGGCGTLGAAAALMGADHIELLYVYSESLEMATANAEDLELDIDFVQCDIRNLGWRGSSVDTVIMNPPFGTRRKGADMEFLSTALKVRILSNLLHFPGHKSLSSCNKIVRYLDARLLLEQYIHCTPET